MTVLSSGLETFDYNEAYWNHIYNRNMDLLDNLLLKFGALQDVDISNIVDGAVVIYNSSTQTWEVKENEYSP